MRKFWKIILWLGGVIVLDISPIILLVPTIIQSTRVCISDRLNLTVHAQWKKLISWLVQEVN